VKMFYADKTRMIGLPYGEKTVTIIMSSRFHLIPERDGQTDRRTELLYQYPASAHCRTIKILSLLDSAINLQQDLHFSSHLKHVTTLPCETSAADMFDFQQISDGVRGHVQVRKNEPDIRRF